jgi:biopolymer transport protein ExbD
MNMGTVMSKVTLLSEINTTPLVDMMLVLLVIFIITAPILSHSQSKVPTSQKPTVVR